MTFVFGLQWHIGSAYSEGVRGWWLEVVSSKCQQRRQIFDEKVANLTEQLFRDGANGDKSSPAFISTSERTDDR